MPYPAHAALPRRGENRALEDIRYLSLHIWLRRHGIYDGSDCSELGQWGDRPKTSRIL